MSRWSIVWALVALLAFAGWAGAGEKYPDRPIRLIVG
jgi:hypothetical protein